LSILGFQVIILIFSLSCFCFNITTKLPVYSSTGSSTINVIFGKSGSFSPPNVNLSPLPYAGVRYFTGTGDRGGWSVSVGVDVNNDGFDDILIGAALANSNHGNAYVIFGSASTVDSSISQLGNFNGITFNASLASNNGFGSSVALEKNMGTNTRGLFVSSVPPVAAPVPFIIFMIS
jgi:hypothetical protein